MPRSKNDITDLINLFFSTNRLIHEKSKDQNESGALSFAHVKTLSFIKEKSQPTMKELADYLGITPPSTTTLIEYFFKNNLINRVYDKSDRRIIRLEITEAGRNSLENGYKNISLKMEKILESLNQTQINNLKDVLETIAKHYKN